MAGNQDTTNVFPIGSYITYIANPTYVYKIYDFSKDQNKYFLSFTAELGAQYQFKKDMVESQFRVATDAEMALYNTRLAPPNIKQT